MINVTENLHTMGPVFAAVWIVTILCVLLRPQRYLNSLLLMAALLVTMIFVSGFSDTTPARGFCSRPSSS